MCKGYAGFPAHALAESKAVQAYRPGDWCFHIITVHVQDATGREWGRSVIGGFESGSFPLVTPEGQVTPMWTDPLPDKGEEYCPVREHDLIGEALRDAVVALAEFGTPTLTAPENASDTGL